jgi:hypothetical protein
MVFNAIFFYVKYLQFNTAIIAYIKIKCGDLPWDNLTEEDNTDYLVAVGTGLTVWPIFKVSAPLLTHTHTRSLPFEPCLMLPYCTGCEEAP